VSTYRDSVAPQPKRYAEPIDREVKFELFTAELTVHVAHLLPRLLSGRTSYRGACASLRHPWRFQSIVD